MKTYDPPLRIFVENAEGRWVQVAGPPEDEPIPAVPMTQGVNPAFAGRTLADAELADLLACPDAIGTPPNFGRCNACRARGCRVAGREVDLAECRACLAGAGPPEVGSPPP